MSSKLVVLTGGPGSGKTAVLERLRELGFATAAEVARRIIVNRRRQGLSPRPTQAEFARAILLEDINQYRSASVNNQLTFFDRGVPDSLAMLNECNALAYRELEQLLAQYRYHPTVFVFPPWEEIYRVDSERDQDYGEAVLVHDLLKNWYQGCGYSPAPVPLGSVAERCDFVLSNLRVAI